VLRQRPLWLTAQSTLIAALWNLGRQDDARMISTDLLAGHPNFSLARWARLLPYRRQGDLDALVNPLRMAGLPE
jgi:adenylate cyclase